MKFLRILFLFLFTCLFLSLCACAEELPFEYAPLSETEAEITRCNIAYGEILEVLTATKTAKISGILSRTGRKKAETRKNHLDKRRDV